MAVAFYGKEPLMYTNIQRPYGQVDGDFNNYMSHFRQEVQNQKVINKSRLDALEHPDPNSEIERQRKIYDTVIPPPNREADSYSSGRKLGWLDEVSKPLPKRWGDKDAVPLPPMKQDIYYNDQVNHQNKLTKDIVNNKRAGTSEHKNGEILFDKINDAARDPFIRYPVFRRMEWKSINNPGIVLPMINPSRVVSSSAWRSDQKVPHKHTVVNIEPSQNRVTNTTQKVVPSFTLKSLDAQIQTNNLRGHKDFIDKPAFHNSLLKLPEQVSYNLTNKDTRAEGYAPEKRDTDFNLNHDKVMLDERLSLKADFDHLKHVGTPVVPVHLKDDNNPAAAPHETWAVTKEQPLHAPVYVKPDDVTDTAVFTKGSGLGKRLENTTDDRMHSEPLPLHRGNVNMSEQMTTVGKSLQGVYDNKNANLREIVTSNRTNIHIDTSQLARRDQNQGNAPIQERPKINKPLRFIAASTMTPVRVSGEVRYQQLNQPQQPYELRDSAVTLQERDVGKNLGASVVQLTKRNTKATDTSGKRKNVAVDTSTYGLKTITPYDALIDYGVTQRILDP